MIVAALTARLQRRHGMRFDALTEQRLHRALVPDGDEAGVALDARAVQVAGDPGLDQELLDAVTLQESSFFRDPPVFDDLGAHLLPQALRTAQGSPLVVWSAGCANGQETWSLAMLLSELGASSFEVVASDISATAVARTIAGVYEERELRGPDPARRARLMTHDGGAWRVRDEPRRHARVVRQNVATQPAPVPDASCALVLCRYLLIYLTPDAAGALLERIAAALSSAWAAVDRVGGDTLEAEFGRASATALVGLLAEKRQGP